MKTNSLILYVNASVWRRVLGIMVFTALTALTARITIHLPFTPVPITLQTLAVILSGLVLGAKAGGVAQLLYLGLIMMGLPVDANALGLAALLSPTAGYLLGFMPAAFITGYLAERFALTSWRGNFMAAITGMMIIYCFGFSWLAVWLQSSQQAWLLGVVPFIVVDIVKALIAAGVAESGKLLFKDNTDLSFDRN